MAGRPKKHGLSKHPLYRVWYNIKLKCLDPDNISYPEFGGQGISMQESWAGDDPTEFIRYCESLDRGDEAIGNHLVLERIDQSLGFQEGNLHWITAFEAQANRPAIPLIKAQRELFRKTTPIRTISESQAKSLARFGKYLCPITGKLKKIEAKPAGVAIEATRESETSEFTEAKTRPVDTERSP